MSVDIRKHVLRACDIPLYKPTHEEEKCIREAVAFLVVKTPFFAHLLYQECTIVYSTAVPWAATDGKQLIFNPQAMIRDKWDIANVAFVIAHEVAHCMFGDLLMRAKWRKDGVVICRKGRQIEFFPSLMNEAEDYRINAMLVEARIGKMPSVGLYDKNLSEKGMESSVDLYEILYDRLTPQQKKSYQPGSGSGGGFDLHLEPTEQTKRDVESGKHTQAIAAAIQAAEATGQGSIPSAVKQLVGDLLEPKVSWQDQLRAVAMRATGDPAYNWKLMDKRLMVRGLYFARTDNFGAGCVAVGYDTSGSCISQKVQTAFFSEMAGIVADINPEQLLVLWCDSKIQRVDDLDEPEDMEELRLEINRKGGAPGGGGTSFRPPFKWLEEQGIQPDLFVYLTDGEGTYPAVEPNFPVVWAIMKGHRQDAPFGTVIEVEI